MRSENRLAARRKGSPCASRVFSSSSPPVLPRRAACGSPPLQSPPVAPPSHSGAPGDQHGQKRLHPVLPDADAATPPVQSSPSRAAVGSPVRAGRRTRPTTSSAIPARSKGGTLREYILDFPGTLRIEGPESNSALNYTIGPIWYESLLSIHPTTLDYMPALATHWQISPDKMTYRFRLNPNARWSDGEPVVADDDGMRPGASRWTRGCNRRAPELVFWKIREAGRREQVHRARQEQAAQLAELPVLLRHVDPAVARAQDRGRRQLSQGIQLQDAARHGTVHGQRTPTSSRGRACRSGGEPITGPRNTAATSASTTSTRSGRSSCAIRSSRSRCSRRATSTTTT